MKYYFKRVLMALLMVVTLVVSVSGTDRQVAITDFKTKVDRMMKTATDSIIIMEFDVPIVGAAKYSTFSGGFSNKGPSKMMWVINKTRKFGFCLDLFEDISSVYTAINIDIVNAEYNKGSSALLVTGYMVSDVGNTYAFLFNDNFNILSMQGPGVDGVILRKYTNLSVEQMTVSEYLSRKI